MVRQHVNPLSRFFQQQHPLPPLQDLFPRPERPLHLDIGCARGRFLLAMAPLHPERLHLGLEIRRSLVALAEADRERLELENLRLLFANANVSLAPWLATLPTGQLELVTIQFPDPWFKARHHKRRMVQPELLQALATALDGRGELLLQSDVPMVMEHMLEAVATSGAFEPADGGTGLLENPLPVRTERERHVLQQGLPVYRRLFRRGRTWQGLHNPSGSPVSAQ
jgi:tRNA (guanine-N7-)-methyltransferase